MGSCHEAIQRRLLAETTFTYPKALEIARGMESADKDSNSFKKADTINAIRCPANPNRQFESCYRCGRSNHNAANCKFKEAQSHNCGKTGHIAPACCSKVSHIKVPQTKSTPGQTKTHIKGKKTHHLQDDTQPPTDENANSSEDEFGLHRMDTHSADPIIVSLSLNEQNLTWRLIQGQPSLSYQKPQNKLCLETELYTNLIWYSKHT